MNHDPSSAVRRSSTTVQPFSTDTLAPFPTKESNRGAGEIEVFFDGDCPLCRREVSMLQRRDGRGRITFTDIASPDFDPRQLGTTFEALMSRIHGRLPDGRLVDGVEVFRRAYAAVGFRRLVAVTRWPLLAWLLEVAYEVFARNRLRLTGRCSTGVCQAGDREPA